MTILENAIQSLKKSLAAGKWLEGERLPSIDRLAEMCKVSRSTMWRVIVLLKRESLVAGKRGGALYAGPSIPSLTNGAQKSLVWVRLKERIGQDLLSASLWRNALPPINKLAKHYGAAVDTCRKALYELTREGLLIRDGRAFKRARVVSSTRYRTMLLIGEGTTSAGIHINNPRTGRLVQAFEQECSRLEYLPVCEGYSLEEPGALLKVPGRLKTLGQIDGIMLTMWKYGNEARKQAWNDLIHFLLKKGFRLILVDQEGSIEFSRDFLRSDRCRVLRIAGVRAGEKVARLCIERGHKRLAYIGAPSNESWVQERYVGLKKCVEQYAGSGASIEHYTLAGTNDSLDLTFSAANLSLKELQTLFKDQMNDYEYTSFIERINKFRWSSICEKDLPDVKIASLRQVAKYLVDFSKKEHDPYIFKAMRSMLINVGRDVAAASQNLKQFEQFVKKTKATVWICADDKIAVQAVAFLRSKNIRVPEDISVIGFENWRETHEAQVSSYDFSMMGIVQQAMMMFMDDKVFTSSRAISEVDGYVVNRKSMRR